MKLKDKKGLIIGGAVMSGVVLLAVGVTIAVLSGDPEPTGEPGFVNETPALLETADEPGSVSIEPLQISMAAGPDGNLQGTATVSALFQDLTVSKIEIVGDARYSWSSSCLQVGQILSAGDRCAVTIAYREAFLTQEPSGTPRLVVSGSSRTPGGDVIPVEASAAIGDEAASIDPGLNFDVAAVAPGDIDPYGPAPEGSPIPNAPPFDFSQAPVPVSQPTLSPREQFLLARRQAVFSGARPNSASAAASQRRQGTWDDLNIPTSTSSLPQDMSRVITMDRIITAALTRPYDSRASQQVVAQVDRNVYGAHGRNILIPRGSTLIGTAQGGAERVAIAWTQLIRPDGARFVIEATAGDAMGQAGVPGRVNQRLLKRYGSILLGTALNVGVAAAGDAMETAGTGDNAAPARNEGLVISDIVRQDLEKITSDIMQRTQNIQPIVTVPAGTRITVIPTMDLVLRPMTGPQVRAQSYPRAQNAGAAVPRVAGASRRVGNGNGQANGQAAEFDLSGPPVGSTQQAVSLPPSQPPATGTTPPWSAN